MQGTIFDIKEFSIHDGPGARITVFLKGCPLRCKWCHNPEGLVSKPQIMHKEKVCVHCGKCKEGCNHEDCKPFDRCIHACPNGAISVTGKIVDAKILAQNLKSHKEFLNKLNGGITISGGEPLMQSEFVCELLDNLDGVHKAIETSGYADFEIYKKVIDKCDYILQDIKLVNDEEHIKYTGVSNEKILKNIEYLKQSGKKFIFRTPLIPGITDTKENLKQIESIVENYPHEKLKYNELAGAKYEMLGMQYGL